MFRPDSIIKTFLVTEKTTHLMEAREMGGLQQYTFEVYPGANRRQVAAAIEKMYGVTVRKVNILNHPGKLKRNRMVRGAMGRTAKTKKAIVSLVPGDHIDLD